MQDLAVALILLAISVVVIATIGLVCRLLGVWKLTTLFGKPEEKSALTRSTELASGGAEYVVGGTDEEEARLRTGVHPQYDTMQQQPAHEGYDQPISATSPTDDTMSIASDYEPTHGLQRAVSCDSVASDISVMELEPEAPKVGQLEFGLEYDREVSELVVSVIQARELEENESTGTQDSYVKLWLSPSRENKVQTKIQRDTCDPVFKERFLFNIDPEALSTKTINFQVYSCDKYARQKLLGETDLKLGDIDLRQPLRVWMNLRDLDEKPTELGDMMFSLSYLPTAERLTVVVVKCRSLQWTSGKENGDCCVKVYLLQNGKKVSKKKTSTKREEKNPIFNEAMIFSVPASALQTLQLRLSVVECTTDGSKAASIGHVIVGSQLTGTSLTHWNQMMSSLRKPVAMWHALRK